MTTNNKRVSKLIGVIILFVLVFTSMQLFPAFAQGTELQSDEFSGGLNTSVWTVVNPLGDATINTDAGHLVISVPAGTKHTVSGSATDPAVFSNTVAGISQDIPNQDFEVEVKFDSGLPGPPFQIQGILIMQDNLNLIRFDFHSYQVSGGATPVYGTAIYGARVVDGKFSNLYSPLRTNIGNAGDQPLYLRVKRERIGNDILWTPSYSFNGSTWTSLSTVKVSMLAAKLVIFAGNSDNSVGTIPAHTARVDYVRNLGGGGVVPPPDPTEEVTPPPTNLNEKIYIPLTMR